MMKQTLIWMALATAAAGGFAVAQDKNQTWTDPEKAAAEDPDFTIQGEYGRDEKDQDWGLQVIAMGDGNFDAYLLEGGLPGLGWDREKQRIKLTGKSNESGAMMKSADGKVELGIGPAGAVFTVGGVSNAVLPRIERESPTLGAKPPEGAIVLFDGSNADEWKNGKVEDGLLPNSNITTKRTFGSYTMHLEVRTPYKPFARGQGRGNSGVYHQGRFETQVLDSFGLEGKNNEFGGIYSIADSRINMCFPPLRWQTYDVDFTAAKFDGDKVIENPRITVRVNGVVVHENQELPKSTTASPINGITPEPGPIHIQHHGNPVYYRNIWILTKD
ncbi:MAG: hypothetical protein ACI8UO_002928 [Verrucomicrobiales bacterium]|jgi:hypothetical protein